MKLKKLESCGWLKVFLGLFLLELIDCDCKFPKKTIANGRYLYASKGDAKEAWAKELYVLRFRCFSGYKLEGPKYILCLDGEWTEDVPFCEKMLCSDPPEIANGIYELYLGVNNLPTIGAMATYSCETGYDLEDTSAANLVCVLDSLADKTLWSGKMPSCQERKTCPDPGVSKHGSREGDCCYARNVLRFLCEEDYELVGDEEILCLSSGRWSSGRPVCKQKVNMGGESDTETEELKKAGGEIYCIAITGDVRVNSLYKTESSSEVSSTSHEKCPNVFILKSYDSMLLLIQNITNGTKDYSQCGLGREDIVIENRSRILDGKQNVKPWPWMAALYFYPTESRSIDDPELKCGGSIINENFILTAAHCMYEGRMLRRRDKQEIIVKLGLTNIKNKTFVQDFEVKEMYIHSKYQPGSYHDYDIALLQLDRPIQFTAYISPICLPPKELPSKAPFYKDNEYGWVIGWGHDGTVNPSERHFRLRMTDNLKEISLPIQSTETCTKSLENLSLKTEYFTERMFCAGDGKTGNDPCLGDGGGPLMQSWMNPEGYIYWTQVGIVSWGIGCGIENTYGFYTHVHNLRSWIEEIINVAPTFGDEISEDAK